MAPHHHRQMGVLVPDGLMAVGPTPICNRRQRAGVTALGRYLPHHILACGANQLAVPSRGKRIEQRHTSSRNVGNVTGDKRQSVHFGRRCQEAVDQRQGVRNAESRPSFGDRTRRQGARDLPICSASVRTIGPGQRLGPNRSVVSIRSRDVFRQGLSRSFRFPSRGFERPIGLRSYRPDRACVSRK